eukprot:1151501-Pelagomonas_calceolata.AAC.5
MLAILCFAYWRCPLCALLSTTGYCALLVGDGPHVHCSVLLATVLCLLAMALMCIAQYYWLLSFACQQTLCKLQIDAGYFALLLYAARASVPLSLITAYHGALLIHAAC